MYAALEELRVLREFASQDYCQHPKYSQCIVLHLFDTSLPRLVYKKRLNSAGRDTLRFTRMEIALTGHKLTLDQLECAVGLIQAHLNIPSPAAQNRKWGGKCAADEVAELE